jgi:hypothetical protein
MKINLKLYKLYSEHAILSLQAVLNVHGLDYGDSIPGRVTGKFCCHYHHYDGNNHRRNELRVETMKVYV